MRKSEEDQGTRLLLYGTSVLLGGIGSFAVALLFLFLASVGISHGLIDPGIRYQLTVVACVLGGFCGGLFAVRRSPARALFVGIAVGVVQFLIQLTVGLLLYDTFSLENGGVGLLCGALCGGAAAGILSGGGKRRPAKSKKRRGR